MLCGATRDSARAGVFCAQRGRSTAEADLSFFQGPQALVAVWRAGRRRAGARVHRGRPRRVRRKCCFTVQRRVVGGGPTTAEAGSAPRAEWTSI